VLCRRRILTAPSTPPKPISAGSQGTWFRGFDSIRNTHHYRDSFTGSAGLATISKSTADLVTDSRYWFQAEKEVDENWDWITVSVFTLRLKKLPVMPSAVNPVSWRQSAIVLLNSRQLF
jgi:hypothetical protein